MHHQLLLGGNHERAHGSVRLTLGRFTRPEEIEQAAEALSEVIGDLRKISPLGKE